MCGITGIFNFQKKSRVNEPLLVKMRDEMIHRGPDDFGLWISGDGFTGLAHRRLSIIDLSHSATQPMCNEDNTIWVTFNGEIYNHAEIRIELVKKGHRFKTDHSDTEVIVHGFEEWGIACLQKFRGMFAIGIWDDSKKELWLVRDRIGVKPLYYTNNNGSFIFASEIKSLLVERNIKREVNEEAFYHYLSFLTSPSPQTMFKNIEKLSAGHYLKIDSSGNIKIGCYWDVFDFTDPLSGISEADIAERLIDELRVSVKYRAISDVPVGIFLSGGIDSSVNAALFSEGRSGTVDTFTIGYEGDNPSYLNEFEYARKMAKFIGANHHEKILGADDFIDFLNTLVFHQDEPIADPVCFPIFHVSKLAKDNGVTVCQVGEGSDELFMGYPGWLTALKLYKLNNLPIPNFIKKAGLSFLKLSGKRDSYSYEWLRRGVEGLPIFWGGAEAFFEPEKKLLISEKLRKNFKNFSSFEAIRPIFNSFNEKAWSKTPLAWMSYLDLKFRLPELLLMRVDKMSMAVSLEARVPFLDHKFVEFAMSVPEETKTGGNELKHILKKSVKGIIPDEIIYRSKQGFGVPIYEWFSERLGVFARKKIVNFADKTDYFDKKYLHELLKSDDAKKIWYVLNFALWHEAWVE
jgi:asparagine synthase (glutamine-hydrolysing)